jgi:2,5-diamino-6-(ribosylamino)-4(3H)-pyrimidinone 5'-phosphate reductase
MRVSSSTLHSQSPRPAGTPITAPRDGEVLRLFPEPTARLEAEDVYAGIGFPRSEEAARPYVVINMISSVDGKATVGGKTGPMGSRIDRTVMRTLRSQADAVMIGAGTLRAEKLTLSVPDPLARTRASRGLNPQPLAVLLTRSGDLPLSENLVGYAPDNLLILASPETTKERLADLSTLACVEVVEPSHDAGAPGLDPGLDVKRALTMLKKRHAVDILLVEGGPRLNHDLLREGLADELFLTLAPKLIGGTIGGTRPGALTILEGPALPHQEHQEGKGPRLISIYLSNDELFLRYALCPH